MAHPKIPITAVKLIPYFTDTCEKVVIVILLDRICVSVINSLENILFV